MKKAAFSHKRGLFSFRVMPSGVKITAKAVTLNATDSALHTPGLTPVSKNSILKSQNPCFRSQNSILKTQYSCLKTLQPP